MTTPKRAFLSGVTAELPLLIGVLPFGLIFGVLAIGAGIPRVPAQAMSSIVFAGSAQFITAQLAGSRTPATIIILTIAIVNLRHALYSASITPYLRGLSRAWKWGLAYLLTDEAYAVIITEFQKAGDEPDVVPQRPKNGHWYFMGAGLALWVTWQLSTAAGIFLGAQVPASFSLDFTLSLTFIALIVPNLNDRASVGAALVAGTVAVLVHSMPYQLGLVTAALVGILAGLWLETREGRT
jgi:4-azaleucine resistance transporter AzlC